MPVRLVTAAALAAALLSACERGGKVEQAERPARTEADGAATRPAPEAAAGEGAREGRTAARRGDRHARAAARQSPRVKRVEGKLARKGERQVVIRPPGSPELTLRVAPGTTVTVDGRPARVEALREGAEIRASYQTGNGGRPTAVSIEARQAPAAAPAEAPLPHGEPSGG